MARKSQALRITQAKETLAAYTAAVQPAGPEPNINNLVFTVFMFYVV